MIGMVKLQGMVDTPWLQSKVLQGNLPGDHTERMLRAAGVPVAGIRDLGRPVSGDLRFVRTRQQRSTDAELTGLG